tara:strand:- start:848 stop:1093 length:246 start_codon:yes stop_codon:yes gene_type:complete
MTRLLEILTIIGTLIGAFVFFVTIASANGAPQEASGTAMALAFALIPYCLSSTSQRRANLKLQEEIRDLARTDEAGETRDA